MIFCNRIIEAKIVLKEMKNCSPDKIILSYLNIKSLKNKFDFLKNTVRRNIDILLISEIKLDDLFPSAQFKIDGIKAPFRFDINSKGG